MTKTRLAVVFVFLSGASVATSVRSENPIARLLEAARGLSKAKTVYDPAYVALEYPRGDPGRSRGVCSDIVIRAFRRIGVDLQELVHEDMKSAFSAYRAREVYGQQKPDPNIDHRRVTNLVIFFSRHWRTLPRSLGDRARGWAPGDVVIFDLYGNGNPSHIGIISDRRGSSGLPLVFHHYPPLPAEDDCLKRWPIVGHYRYPATSAAVGD